MGMLVIRALNSSSVKWHLSTLVNILSVSSDQSLFGLVMGGIYWFTSPNNSKCGVAHGLRMTAPSLKHLKDYPTLSLSPCCLHVASCRLHSLTGFLHIASERTRAHTAQLYYQRGMDCVFNALVLNSNKPGISGSLGTRRCWPSVEP